MSAVMTNRSGDRVGGGKALAAWEMSFNGRFWHEMPGATVDDKKMNFFFFRRGTLDLEDEQQVEANAADGITEVVEGAKKPRLRMRTQTRFGSGNWQRKPKKEAERVKRERTTVESRRIVITEEELKVRAKLKLRIQAFYQRVQRGGQAALSMDTGISVDSLKRIVQAGVGLTPERQVKIAAVLDRIEFDIEGVQARLKETLKTRRKRSFKGAPKGFIALKDWVKQEAIVQGVSVSTIFMRLNRGKMPYPPGVRVNARCYYVTSGEGVAA